MEKKHKAKLKLLSERSLTNAIIPGLISCCPSMDLVALGTSNNQIQIYRGNGQEVYRSNQKNDSVKVNHIAWKPSGQLLATAWSDGTVRLVSAESTKTVHQFDVNSKSGIACIGWASTSFNPKAGIRTRSDKHSTWNELLFQQSDDFEYDHALDLPQDLSHIDIETSLPKLSVLASGGTSEDVFSSRSSLDALFRPFDTKDIRAADVMVVGSREGNVHLSIYDSFVIGTFKSPTMSEGTSSSLVLHASSQQYSTHSLLFRTPKPDNRLFFVPMDLRFVSSSSDHLSLLASRSSALQNLLRYIHEVHRLMVLEWESTRDLPGKFLRNVDGDLKEKDNRDIVQALYHSVATGHTFPIVKEWLVDELAERGHKRWDKAVTSGLQNLKQLVHENMIPALDRCSIILSRFAGIAKFRGSGDTIAFSSKQISQLQDTISCLHLVAAKILTHVVDELELFTAFSAWLRHEIDRLASEESTSADDEMAEKESGLEQNKVLLYIQTALKTSPVANYLSKGEDDDEQAENQDLQDGDLLFETLIRQINKMEQGQQYQKHLPQQAFLTRLLSIRAKKVFQQIADSEKRNVLFGDAYEIGDYDADSPLSMKIDAVDSATCMIYVTRSNKTHPGRLHLVCLTLSIEKGISKINAVVVSSVQLGNGMIKDIKFLRSTLLVLWAADDTRTLLAMPYKSSAVSAPEGVSSSFEFHYEPHTPSTKQIAYVNQTLTNEQVRSSISHHEIPGGNGAFKAGSIDVGEGAKYHGSIKQENARVLFIAENGMKYKMCEIEESSHEDADEDIEMSQEV